MQLSCRFQPGNANAILVLILDGNPEIGANVRSNLSYLICSRHLIRSRNVTDRIFFSPKITIFLHACDTCSELPSNISTIVHIIPDVNMWDGWTER